MLGLKLNHVSKRGHMTWCIYISCLSTSFRVTAGYGWNWLTLDHTMKHIKHACIHKSFKVHISFQWQIRHSLAWIWVISETHGSASIINQRCLIATAVSRGSGLIPCNVTQVTKNIPSHLPARAMSAQLPQWRMDLTLKVSYLAKPLSHSTAIP